MIDFASVDTTNAEEAIHFLSVVSELGPVKEYRSRALAALEIADNDRVLEIGCGLGGQASEIARRVGTGSVTALDSSANLLAIARQRFADQRLPVKFFQGDATALPYADGFFNKIYLDRVLHVLDAPEAAAAEMTRVLARNGRLSAAEPKWSSLTISGGNQRLDAIMRDVVAQSTIGNASLSLAPLFRAAGLSIIETDDVVVETTDLDLAAYLFSLEQVAGQAVSAGRLSIEDAMAWLRSLQTAAGEGLFHASLEGTRIVAVK